MLRRLFFRLGTACALVLAVVIAVSAWATVHVAQAAPVQKAEKPTVVFLGDSYTAGTGDPQYWRTTSKLMCWNAINLGKRGTGYINPGRKGGVFADRVDSLAWLHPSVVIVQGSYNDKNPDAVEAAAEALFRAIQLRVPRAEVFAMSPVSRPKPGSSALVAANSDAVRRAAGEAGVKFIDARNFVAVERSEFRRDLVHPNAAGHKAIGKHLASSLPDRLNACPDD